VPFPCLQNCSEEFVIDKFKLRCLQTLTVTWFLNERLLASNMKLMRSPADKSNLWTLVVLVGKSKFSQHIDLSGTDEEVRNTHIFCVCF
jgi:hypothetical protein